MLPVLAGVVLVSKGILGVAIAASIAFYCFCTYCTLGFQTERPQPQGKPQRQPSAPLPVSILIPVRGVDPGAMANWTSFCQQHYHSHYEVLFGVKDPDDPAVPILQQLAAQFPERVRLLVGLEPRGINHQISNLIYLFEAAQYETIILADSDIRVGADYLSAVVAPLADPEVGLVTCPYVEKRPRYIGAALHTLNRCTEFIPSLLIARLLDGGLRCALGPTIATRKSVMSTFGGLNSVANRIGSDYHIGKMTAQSGYRVELSGYVLDNDGGNESVGQVFARELRWARTIRINRGAQYYGMAFTFGTVYALLLLLVSGLAPWAIALFFGVWAVRIMQAAIAIVRLNRPQLWRWMWLLPLRDGMSFVIWLQGSFGRRVYWRGRWLNIGTEGSLAEARGGLSEG
ncbi:glycosyltransferase [Synechococcus sp. PCC 7336]|uniref:glycosyltransferase n=1 Tax=Synechococcus sp. PCC 7336 TaxID=195250 RepID=UPI000349A401|nr:glycosyltransferase [Synechococcus sp. PCC 7336]